MCVRVCVCACVCVCSRAYVTFVPVEHVSLQRPGWQSAQPKKDDGNVLALSLFLPLSLSQGRRQRTHTHTHTYRSRCRHFTPSRRAAVSFHITALPAVAAAAADAATAAATSAIAVAVVVVAPRERTMSKLKFSTVACLGNRSAVHSGQMGWLRFCLRLWLRLRLWCRCRLRPADSLRAQCVANGISSCTLHVASFNLHQVASCCFVVV